MAGAAKVIGRKAFPGPNGRQWETVLREDRTTACECEFYAEDGTCGHLREAVRAWTAEGLFGGVQLGLTPPANGGGTSSEPSAPPDEGGGSHGSAPAAPPAAGSAAPQPTMPALRPEAQRAAVTSIATREIKPRMTIDDYRQKVQEGGFYQLVKWNPRTQQEERTTHPGAVVWNAWSLDGGITCEYVRDKDGKPIVGMDATHAWAMVRGKKGHIVREASVTIIFAVEEARLHVEKLAKRAKEIKKARERGGKEPSMLEYVLDSRTGLPIVTDPLEQIDIINQSFRKRTFGDREATTKAERIVQCKLLGVEFQDQEEVESEADDVHRVNAAQNTQAGAPEKVEPVPPTPAAVAAASRFPSTPKAGKKK